MSEWQELKNSFDSHLAAFKAMSKREKIDTIIIWCDIDRRELANRTDEQLDRLYTSVMNSQARSVECSLM